MLACGTVRLVHKGQPRSCIGQVYHMDAIKCQTGTTPTPFTDVGVILARASEQPVGLLRIEMKWPPLHPISCLVLSWRARRWAASSLIPRSNRRRSLSSFSHPLPLCRRISLRGRRRHINGAQDVRHLVGRICDTGEEERPLEQDDGCLPSSALGRIYPAVKMPQERRAVRRRPCTQVLESLAFVDCVRGDGLCVAVRLIPGVLSLALAVPISVRYQVPCRIPIKATAFCPLMPRTDQA
jgi:hypothetical protein